MALHRSVEELIGDARATVREAVGRAGLAKAWNALLERDAEDTVRGALPYTDQAIESFAEAHRQNPDDIGIVHHLAIAHHARAWDMELKGDPNAESEWLTALGFWHSLAVSNDFAVGLEAKLLTCDPNAEPATIIALRQDLIGYLLDVHIDFINQYCELKLTETGERNDQPALTAAGGGYGDSLQRSAAHVRVVERSLFSESEKARFTAKLFESLTGSVPDLRAMSHYDAALSITERFLTLVPDYMPALRTSVEVAKDWISGLSFKDKWDEIMHVAGRAEPFARRLEQHPRLDSDPLAKTALDELEYEVMLRSRDRGQTYLTVSDSRPTSISERDAAKSDLDLGLEWGHMGFWRSPDGSNHRALLSLCLYYSALVLFMEASELLDESSDEIDASVGYKTRINAALRLYRRIIAQLEEALVCTPGDQVILEGLETIREKLSRLELEKSLLS